MNKKIINSINLLGVISVLTIFGFNKTAEAGCNCSCWSSYGAAPQGMREDIHACYATCERLKYTFLRCE